MAKVTTEDRDRRRRVLGVRKDPFRPAPVKKPKTEQDGGAPSRRRATQAAPSGGTGGGAAASPRPRTPAYYEAGTIIVRFGEASETGEL